MNSKQAILILFILIVGVAVLSSTVESTRVLKEDFAANHLVRLPSNYEQTKLTMTSWLGRLVSGPSQGGKGH
ncbi:hypothetical protein MKW98_028986 [Papaver atlanticum]|uniref:Transmembrane protein n=1 Tax=Papaver atlanticum TaxID=357466 RepID=A0AAD4TLI1_9MAGN|nr:hypothetical protein MKW98_028986 [Papaver atlanticum]